MKAYLVEIWYIDPSTDTATPDKFTLMAKNRWAVRKFVKRRNKGLYILSTEITRMKGVK